MKHIFYIITVMIFGMTLTASLPVHSQEMKYNDIKKEQLEEVTATKIYGIPIKNTMFSLNKNLNLFPIWGCICVQDTPQNPCPCKQIIWLPKDKIFGSGKTKRHNRDGHEIHWFKVKNDAEIIVESHDTMRISQYSNILGLSEGCDNAVLFGPKGRFGGSTLPSCTTDVNSCQSVNVEVPCGSLPGGGTQFCNVPKTRCDYICTWPNGSKGMSVVQW